MKNEELVKLYQEGDKQALDILIEQNTGIIKKMTNKYMGINKMLEFDDLFDSGVIGFIYAAKKYNYNNEKKAQFITYAVFYIDRYIHSCVNGRNNKDVANNKFYDSCISLNTPIASDSDDNIDIQDTIESQEQGFENVEDKLYLKQLRIDLESVMKEINTLREREIIELHFGWNCEKYSYPEIGQIFGISRERVTQIVYNAYKKIRQSTPGKKLKLKYAEELILYTGRNTFKEEVERRIDLEAELRRTEEMLNKLRAEAI